MASGARGSCIGATYKQGGEEWNTAGGVLVVLDVDDVLVLHVLPFGCLIPLQRQSIEHESRPVVRRQCITIIII